MAPSEIFGRYRILRKLSRGMTDVYLAMDNNLGRRVVLKAIEQARDEFTQIAIEAERRGAAIQKQLHEKDARIPDVYEYGEENGCFFVVMEYFEGRTLANILQEERRLAPERAAYYAAEICSQLKTLHAFFPDVDGRKTAVVHGDIKPSNIQITVTGEPRLLDFGIAKVITCTHNLTHHNLGSPSYCSPERLSQAQVDAHADLWAVGVTLYEMIAGAPPYQAQTTRRLEHLIQSRRPPRALPDTCPRKLAAIINKALAPCLEQRYTSAEALEEDLRAFLEDRPVLAMQEEIGGWNANATIDRRGSVSTRIGRATKVRNAVESVRRWRWRIRTDQATVLIALLAGVLSGLVVFIPIGYYYRFSKMSDPLRVQKDYAHADAALLAPDWTLYQALKQSNEFIGHFFSPASGLDQPMRANLLAAADNILAGFRNSSDGRLSDFDWGRARLCLQYALSIDPDDTQAKGKLALCEGYQNLCVHPGLPQAEHSVQKFREAAAYMPHSPDPHLGLARAYIYAYHNVGQALAEFHLAEQLGFRLGPREAEEEADGYLFRAEWELSQARNLSPLAHERRLKWLAMARADLARARRLYEPIAGFSQVNASLIKVDEAASEQEDLETASLRLITTRPRVRKRTTGIRQWQ
jgi:predicted Ser/Thr protein kinase